MKNFYNCIIVLLLIACISCGKKEYPPSTTEGSPVFNCTMSMNGVPTSIEAGVNNYYMYSSFQQDSNNVYGFIAGLKQTNCTNCPNSLQIQINDFKVSATNSITQIDSSLIPGNYNYLASNAASFYFAQFQSSYNKPAASYLWNFGDGVTSTSINPNHIYKKSGKYNISLTVTGLNSCESSIYNVQNIGTVNYKFRTRIDADSTMGTSINFSSINSQGIGPYQYLWNFGDGTPTSTLANPTHAYQYTGAYPVTLRVIDGNNDTAYAKYNTVTQNDISSCAANYSVNAVSQTPNALGLSNVVVNWIDGNGTFYTSKNAQQPANSYFNILSVENFKNNDNNQLTKKLHVKFTCTIYNGATAILINNADAIICVAYK
ncbi:MAG: PKD domain-containing protein [Bacteroidetes bacterium]|nr:PKD domain-containing protein [Bacteroidota bacterium]